MSEFQDAKRPATPEISSQSLPSSPMTGQDTSPSSDSFVETFFLDGPLGVTLRRRPEDGIVFIHDVVPGSQAVGLDVQPLDELWAVGDSEIGETPLDKEAWNGLIGFIKASSRPLRLVWHRKVRPVTVANPASPPPAEQPAPKAKEPSAEYQELQRIVSRLVVKDTDSKSTSSIRKFNPQSLLSDSRKVLRQGDLHISIKNTTLWGSKKYEKRRVILFNDMLVIGVPQTGNVYALEYVLELPTCKVRSLGHVFGVQQQAEDPIAAAAASSSSKSCAEDLQFDVVAPMGEITFAAENRDVKDIWVLNIFLAICECVGESERVLGWRHQYMLGTMHSAVICRDEARIRELIALCEDGRLSFISIEAPDEDGYTPLHYACIMRLHNIINLLHQATADVTATDRQGLTPLHWAALQLDEYALSLLCQHVFDLDLYDPKQRTPLVICCVEGRDLRGKTDPALLRDCLVHMLSHKPNIHWLDSAGRTLIHYLAASWQHEALEFLLEHDCSDVNAQEYREGLTPLHSAVQALPLKRAIGEAQLIMSRAQQTGVSPQSLTEVEALNHPFGVDTLRVLLKAGAKPNAKDALGRTPLAMLLTDLEVQDRWLDREEILPAIALLIASGARVETSDAMLTAALKAQYSDLMVAAFVEKWQTLGQVDGSKLGIRVNHFEVLPDPTAILEGSGSSHHNSNDSSPHAANANNNSANGSNTTNSSSSTSALSNVPASARIDSQRQCELCAFTFTLFRRQHHCRLCGVSCCDDCSKKRTVIDLSPMRTCDSCFNRVLTMQEHAAEQARAMAARLETSSTLNTPFPSLYTPSNTSSATGGVDSSNSNNSSNASAAAANAKDQDRRLRLFGSSAQSTKDNKDKDSAAAGKSSLASTAGGASRTMNTLNETHERLQERGEKLNRMSERTEEMANQANEFARLAKQLHEQQKNRWF